MMTRYTKIGIGIFLLFFSTTHTSAQETPPTAQQPGVIVHAGSYEEFVARERALSWLTLKPLLIYHPQALAEIEKTTSCPLDTSLCSLLVPERVQMHTRKITKTTVNKEAVKSFAEDIARQANHDPVDATFAMSDGRVTVFALSEDGVRVNVTGSVDVIAQSLMEQKIADLKEIVLPIDTIAPSITSHDAKNLGLVELIGEGRSDFSGSSKDRIHNITVASNRFHGLLIKPGEEFSFVKHLGPVDGEHGYRPELVIRDHQTKPEFGGGICQVSTTVFRGAIFTGLKITARRNHSYPVKYYKPTGFDATVYVPSPDLRFVNNTPGHILLQTTIEGTELVFRFYGTADGRKTEMQGPFVTKRNPDGSMQTYFVQKVLAHDGAILIEDTFLSNYKSPNDYPKPGDVAVLTEKPKDWSKKEWNAYKASHGM